MGRLDYRIPTAGKDTPVEGAGDISAYFLKNRGRGDESSSPPLVSTNTESLSVRIRQRLSCKAVCAAVFLRRAAEDFFEKCNFSLSIKLFSISIKSLKANLSKEI